MNKLIDDLSNLPVGIKIEKVRKGWKFYWGNIMLESIDFAEGVTLMKVLFENRNMIKGHE